jgi:hypothetical protein
VKRSNMVAKWKARISCFPLIVAGACAAILLVATLLGVREITRDRSSCDYVLWTFAESIRLNETEVAKSLVVKEQWTGVDHWVAGREAAKCSFSLEPDHNQWWYSLVPCLNREDTLCTDFGFICSYNHGIYSLSIEGVVLRESEEKCKVLEWERICETRPPLWIKRCE